MDENFGLNPRQTQKWAERMLCSYDRSQKIVQVVERCKGGESVASACRDLGVNYLELRRWVDRLSGGSDFGKNRTYQGYMDYAEATPEERFYADVFNLDLDSAEDCIPEEAEHTIRLTIGLLGDDRERYILTENYLNDKSLEDLSAELGITRQRVHQIKALALKRLRHPVYTTVLLNGASAYEDARAAVSETRKQAAQYLANTYAKTDELIQEAIRVASIPGTGIKEVKVVSLNLGARVLNCLTRAGIRTIGDLVGRDINDLKKLRNFGQGCFKELVEELIKRGLIEKVQYENGLYDYHWLIS